MVTVSSARPSTPAFQPQDVGNVDDVDDVFTGLSTHKLVGADATNETARTERTARTFARDPREPAAAATTDDYLRKVRDAPDSETAVAAWNQDFAPKLRTEEAALQGLSQDLAYGDLREGARIRLDVDEDMRGNDRSDRYAKEYEVRDVLDVERSGGDVRDGLKAFRLVPADDKEGAEIHLFRGADISSGEGISAALDGKGIGKRAFEDPANHDVIERWNDEARDAGRSVTSTGHSLGGAFAQREHALLAERDPQAFRDARLITYNAPGIDADTAGKIPAEGAKGRVTHVQNEGDVVQAAGEARPAGSTWQTDSDTLIPNPLDVHKEPGLIDAELTKGRAREGAHVREIDDPGPNAFIEGTRDFIGDVKDAGQQLADWVANLVHDAF